MSRRKSSEDRERESTPDVGELVALTGGALEPPPAPKVPGGGKLLASTREWWSTFWTSPVAGLIDRRTDLPALTRLALLYDERDRALKAYRAQRSTTGSTGQLVVNPFAREIASLDGRIASLEDRFGLTPKARFDLGVSFGEAADRLEELNRRMEKAFEDEDDAGLGDPRLEAIDTEAEEAG